MTNQNGAYLAHHGIAGQHWGKRNGPPYPLSGSAHSSSERKAGTKGWSVKAKKEARSKTKSGESSIDKAKGYVEANKDTIIKNTKKGAVAAGAALTVIGLYKTGKLGKLADVGKVAAFNFGKGIGAGAGKGMYKAGERVSETLFGGMTMLAMIEVADLATDGRATDKILKAYNDFTKKDNRVNVEDIKKLKGK